MKVSKIACAIVYGVARPVLEIDKLTKIGSYARHLLYRVNR